MRMSNRPCVSAPKHWLTTRDSPKIAADGTIRGPWCDISEYANTSPKGRRYRSLTDLLKGVPRCSTMMRSLGHWSSKIFLDWRCSDSTSFASVELIRGRLELFDSVLCSRLD